MKWFSANHMKFAYVDSRHNLFHRLTVILIRIVYSLIFIPLSFYLAAMGFSLSAKTIQPYLPPVWFEKVTLYSARLPYFRLIRNLFLNQLGHWYRDALVWWTMVVGIPLMLLGISAFFSNLSSLYYSIISSLYNRTHCPFCKEPIKTKTK